MKNKYDLENSGESLSDLKFRLLSAMIALMGMTAGIVSIAMPLTGHTQALESAAPHTPRNVMALYTLPNGVEVELSWEPPLEVLGAQIAGYEIYRDKILIERVPASRHYFVRKDIRNHAGSVYSVRAITTEGLRSGHGGLVKPVARPNFDLRASL